MKILDTVKKAAKKSEEKEKENTGKIFKKKKLSKDNIGRIIAEPIFTEKSSNLMPLGKYVFRVSNQANKIEVKKAVEGLYDVNVTGVNILKTSAKPRRVGRREMLKPGFKKAIVTLKEGESIELTKG